MNSQMLDWWGFRIQAPPGTELEPIKLVERVIISLVLASSFELFWLAFLILWPGSAMPLLPISLGLALLPILVFLIIPGSVLDRLIVGYLLALSRIRGSLAAWDWFVAGLAGLSLVLVPMRAPHLLVPSTCLFGITFLACLLMLIQPRVTLSLRTWDVNLPEWLEVEGEGREGASRILAPPEQANVCYTFDMDAESYPLGTLLPDSILEELRALNRDSHGRPGVLYQENAAAATLQDRLPINGKGQQELMEIARQIASIAKEHRLSRLRLANAVLMFIQKAIRYEYDRDSTGDHPGGPFDEYGRLPMETLHDGVGDCECTAILCAGLLAYLGFDVAHIQVSMKDRTSQNTSYHLAVGLNAEGIFSPSEGLLDGMGYLEDPNCLKTGNRRKYLYGETAIDGETMAFGFFPKEWVREKLVVIEEIVPIPAPALYEA